MPDIDRLRAALADRYSVERPIASGGMATVYVARDLKHDREVALKVMRPEFSASIGAERFLSEVRITARLDHPHILTLIDSGSADGFLYYVMPYVRGESLRARLVREKQLTLDDALSITRQIASALEYAHRQGVVHRDIKPENILVHEGEVVLADFGVAVAFTEAGGNRITSTGLAIGTPRYMSPEQATDARGIDARSDIYSLGAVLYEMLAGEPPVSGATTQAVLAKLLTEQPTSLRVIRNTVPLSVDAAVGRALAKVPADRFASVGDFIRALGEFAPSPVKKRLSWGRYAIVASTLAIAASIGWFVMRGPQRVALSYPAQVTFNARVTNPSISGDGKQVAYNFRDCGASGCTYGIDLQDVGGSTTRRLIQGANAAYQIEWGQDRLNLLWDATIGGEYGIWILSTSGGSPRRVSPVFATFWGNDSLLVVNDKLPHPDFTIYVTGLDGVARDSIQIPPVGQVIQGLRQIPNSKWIVIGFSSDTSGIWMAIDRSGHESSRLTTPGVALRTSSDAVWFVDPRSRDREKPVVGRIGFNSRSGRFASRVDTIFRIGPYNEFSVTADGATILYDDGTEEFDVWAAGLRDVLRGNRPKESLLHTTLRPRAWLSSDGNRVLLARPDVTGQQLRVLSLDGKPETILFDKRADRRSNWADSVTVAIAEKDTGGSWRFSLKDVRTRVSRESFLVSDWSLEGFRWIPPGGWLWSAKRTFRIRPTRGAPRDIALPSWCQELLEFDVSPDGRRLAVVGWKASTADSIGVSVFSLADGAETLWATVRGEGGGVQWMNDGSLLFDLQATVDSHDLLAIRGPGQIERLGTIPWPTMQHIYVSRDGRRIVFVSRNELADVWTMHLKKRWW